MEKYIAFISYRHQEKTQHISGLLRKRLEGYHLPSGVSVPKKRRVFRDTDELPTSTDLGADIENALKSSGWLICLCTEDYPASKWCLREVEETIELGRKDRILPILVSGDPETSVPAIIRDIPVAADLRGTDGRKLKKKVEEILPALLGKISGCTEAEAAAAERKYRIGTAAAAFAALTAVILGFSLYATRTANRIAQTNEEIRTATQKSEEARDEALEERNIALLKNARYVSRLAWDAINREDADTAIALALSALPENLHGDEPVSGDAIGALRMALCMPSRPAETYVVDKHTDTDFPITGWKIDPCYEDRILLLTGEEERPEMYVTYGDITLGQMTYDKIMEKAREGGWSLGYQCYGGSPQHQVFYGPEKQMMIKGNSATEPLQRYITLDGEPYYADSIYDTRSYYMMAWMSESGPGPSPHAMIIYKTQSEGVPVPELTTCPVCISFAGNYHRVAVIDGTGSILIFDTDTGEKKGQIPGQWAWVCYPAGQSSRICAIDPEGNAWLYNARTLEKEYRFESPAPVRSVLYSSLKGYFLACCDDGIRIYNWQDGMLRFEILTEEKPVFAIWNDYSESGTFALGTSFLAGYPGYVDYYILDTKTNTTQTDYIPLYYPDVSEDTGSHDAVYSPDSRYIYLAYGDRTLTKWDASTGELIWACPERGRADSGVPVDLWLSGDGKMIWHSDYEGKGVQQVFADTGETGYTVPTQRIGTLWESPDGTKVLAKPQYKTEYVLFDAGTGEILWERDQSGTAMFSEDSREVLFVYKYEPESGPREIRVLRLSSDTGEVLGEKALLSFDPEQYPKGMYPDGNLDIYLFSESGKIAVTHETAKDENELRDYTVWLFRIGEEEPCTVAAFRKDYLFVYASYTGAISVSWTDSGTGVEYLQEIRPDGSIGDPVAEKSPEGRKLTTENRVIFAGEEVCREGSAKLVRIADGAVIMDSKLHNTLTVSPDGNSLCLTAIWSTPCVILASDVDTLVQKAYARTGGR